MTCSDAKSHIVAGIKGNTDHGPQEAKRLEIRLAKFTPIKMSAFGEKSGR